MTRIIAILLLVWSEKKPRMKSWLSCRKRRSETFIRILSFSMTNSCWLVSLTQRFCSSSLYSKKLWSYFSFFDRTVTTPLSVSSPTRVEVSELRKPLFRQFKMGARGLKALLRAFFDIPHDFPGLFLSDKKPKVVQNVKRSLHFNAAADPRTIVIFQ